MFTDGVGIDNNVNINVARVAGKLVALAESALPVEFDEDSLETVGPVEFEGDDVGDPQTASPHPCLDSCTGESLHFGTVYGVKNFYTLYSVPDKQGSTKVPRRLAAKVPVSWGRCEFDVLAKSIICLHVIVTVQTSVPTFILSQCHLLCTHGKSRVC